MASFTFLHAADLHLGSPFQGLSLKDEDLARRFASASREAFRELVDKALAEKVAFMVIAGDVYDGEWKDNSIGLFFAREVSRLRRAGAMPPDAGNRPQFGAGEMGDLVRVVSDREIEIGPPGHQQH